VGLAWAKTRDGAASDPLRLLSLLRDSLFLFLNPFHQSRFHGLWETSFEASSSARRHFCASSHHRHYVQLSDDSLHAIASTHRVCPRPLENISDFQHFGAHAAAGGGYNVPYYGPPCLPGRLPDGVIPRAPLTWGDINGRDERCTKFFAPPRRQSRRSSPLHQPSPRHPTIILTLFAMYWPREEASNRPCKQLYRSHTTAAFLIDRPLPHSTQEGSWQGGRP